MKSKIIRSGFTLAFLFTTVTVYQNCAPQNVSFEVSSEEMASQVRGLGDTSFTLNDGNPFTSNSTVQVKIKAPEATHIYLTDDSSCSSGGTWQEVSASKSWDLKSLNALNFVYAKFKKKTRLSETESGCYSASITHDDIAPVVILNQRPDSLSGLSEARFSMRINDDLSGLDYYECQVVGAGKFSSCDSVKDLTSLTDGQKRFQVRAVDRAGNRSDLVEHSWVVDTTAPSVSITSKPAANAASSHAVFEFTADDGQGTGIAQTRCSLDGAALKACTSPTSYSGLLEGTHTFTVQAIDQVGNMSAPLTYTWKSQASSTNDFSILGLTGGQDTIKDKYLGSVLQPTVHWSASPGANGYRVAILNASGSTVVCAEAASSSTSYAFTASQCTLVNGTAYKARVAAYTAAGAIKVAPLYDFSVDVTAPVITVSAPTMSEDQKQATFSPFSIKDTLSGVKSSSCVRKMGTASETINNCHSQTSLVFKNLLPGDHTLTVTATDAAGNVATKAIAFVAKKIVCDPFSTSAIACRQGWKGSIYYYAGEGGGWTQLKDYFEKGTDANVILYMSQIFVPTRTFSNGFPTTDGDLVKKKASDGGSKLVEWFALRMNTIMKLKSTDTAGYYQFALLSDDGSKLYIADSKTSSFKQVIDNDLNHSTKMACSTTAIYMDASSKKPALLEYYQGPRTAIALSLVYRKVSSATPATAAPCGEVTQDFYGFMDNNTGNYAGSKYEEAMKQGWKPMTADNFLLDETIP